MKCPECGNKTKVLETRIAYGIEVARRRVCKNCRHTFFTVEKIDRDGKYLISEAHYKYVNEIKEK